MIRIEEISPDFFFPFPENFVFFTNFILFVLLLLLLLLLCLFFFKFYFMFYIVGLSQSDEGPATLHLRCPSDRNDNSSGQTSADVITDPCRHIGTRHNRR